MRITLSYTMMTGRIERQLDSEAELVVALQELGGAGASDFSVHLIDAPSAETAAATDQTPPPFRQI
ncbi:MAG: hypothetical protein Q8M47_13105, partial [Devosia sp.]|nr:hypothetical protein [Devosia sp.]